MRFNLITLFVLVFSYLGAQTDKLLLEVEDLDKKIEAPRLSTYPMYTDLYTVADLGEGFVLGFGRTFAFVDNNLEIKWKKDLPDYVKMPPKTIALGDEKTTYLVEFGPSFLSFKKCQVTQVNNSTGATTVNEYSWDKFEQHLVDYNYHNGKLSFLFWDTEKGDYIYKLLTIVDGKATWKTIDGIDGADGPFMGDAINGPELKLKSSFHTFDKETKKKLSVYKTVSVALDGNVIGKVNTVEADVTGIEYAVWAGENAIHAAEIDNECYYFIQYQNNTFPQGFLFGKSTTDKNQFKILSDHVNKFTIKIVAFPLIKFNYLPEQDLFVAEVFYMKQIKQGNVRRFFINRAGELIWEDDLEVEPNTQNGDVLTKFATTSYKSKEMQKGATLSFPTELAYYNVIEQYSKKNPEKLIYFEPIKRPGGYILVIIDPNTGKVSARKI